MKRLLHVVFPPGAALAVAMAANAAVVSAFLMTPAWGQTPAAAPPPTAQSSPPAGAPPASAPPGTGTSQSANIPADQENARKAKALLDEAIRALGGEAYLTFSDREFQGRGYSFYHGRPTGTGVLFWSFFEFPDKERVELSKERDVTELYIGEKGFEITYKGVKPQEEKDLGPYLRRRRFSLDTLLRNWVNDPKVALFYEGDAVAAEKPALKITLINGMDEAVDLYLDASTHLPLKKTFTWRDPVDRQKNIEDEIYDNYRPVQGIMTPFSWTRFFNDDMAGQRFLSGASYNQGLDQAMFDPRSGYNPNKVPPKSNKPSAKH